MYRVTITGILILSALVLSSCWGGSPEATVEKMREAACRGDVEGFMSYVDKATVERNWRKEAFETSRRKSGEAESIKMKIIEFIAKKLYEYDYYPWEDAEELERRKKIGAQINELEWEFIAINLKGGKYSGICNLKILEVNNRKHLVKISYFNSNEEWGSKNSLADGNSVR